MLVHHFAKVLQLTDSYEQPTEFYRMAAYPDEQQLAIGQYQYLCEHTHNSPEEAEACVQAQANLPVMVVPIE
jgi:hypothetical protein